MIKKDKINWCDWTADGGALEYDLTYLHPELGVLLQEYQINTTTYEGKLIYQSDFYLFGTNESIPSDFRQLPRLIKSELWEIIFAVKRKFFEEIKPEIVEHFIGQEHSLERRFALYCAKLNLPDYEIDTDKIRRTIIYQKKEIPTGSGGDFYLYQVNYTARPGRFASTSRVRNSCSSYFTAAGARQMPTALPKLPAPALLAGAKG